MCQARRDGGRRCPIHRHDSVAGIQLAVAKTKLETKQVENIFRELTREGRTADAPTPEQWEAYKSRFREGLGDDSSASITRNMDKADEHSSIPDGKTFYALTKLQSRAASKGEQLDNLFIQVSTEKGISEEQLRAQFESNYSAANTAYGEGNPEGYSQRAYTQAKSEGLPYDTQSVVAIDKLRKTEVVVDGGLRVEKIPVHNSTLIDSVGYNSDGGRLEVVMSHNPGHIYAYHNVPEGVWDDMVPDGSPSSSLGSIYTRHVRNNPDYQYDNLEDAERDANSVRCATCGQFSSPVSHSCPERAIEEESEEIPKPTVVDSVAANHSTPIPDNYGEESNDSSSKESIPESENLDNAEDIDAGQRAINRIAEFERQQNQEDISNAEVAIDKTDAEKADKDSSQKVSDKSSPSIREGEDYNPASPSIVKTYNNQGLVEVSYPDESIRNSLGLDEDSRFATYVNMNFVSSDHKEFVESLDKGEFEAIISNLREGDEPLNLHVANRFGSDPKSRVVGISEGSAGLPVFQPISIGDERTHVGVQASPEVLFYKSENKNYTRNTRQEADREIDEEGIKPLHQRSSFMKTLSMDAKNPNSPWKVRVPTAANLKKALEEEHSFRMPIEVELPDTPHTTHMSDEGVPIRSRNTTDDQGYMVDYNRHRVLGSVIYDRGEDGVHVPRYDQRTLRCSCYKYRENYNCEHIDAVLRKSKNITSQLATPQRRVQEDISGLDNSQYLTVALARRTDMVVIPPSDDSEKPIYKFNEINGDRRRQSRWARNYVGEVYRDPVHEINSYEDFQKYGNSVLDDAYAVDFVKTTDVKRDVLAALRRGPVQIPVDLSVKNVGFSRNRNYVKGSVVLENNADGIPAVISHDLKCDCAEYREKYDCPHIRTSSRWSRHIPFIGQREYTPQTLDLEMDRRNEIANSPEYILYYEMSEIQSEYSEEFPEADLREMAEANVRSQNERRAEEQRIDAENEARWEASQLEMRQERSRRSAQRIEYWRESNAEMAEALDEHKSNLLAKWESVESSYSDNPEKLNNAIKDALDRKKNGEAAIPFREEGGVLDGASNGMGGRKFGVELEFELSSSNQSRDLANIGRELHEAGLTTHANQDRYHSAGNNGYRNWSFEEDGTVSGELVSPILDDSPESWRQLKVATDIIRKNGGKGGVKSGSHVHVSTGTYEMSTSKRAELLRLNGEYQDTVHRLATSPERGTHRGVYWCEPNVKDQAGEIHGSVQEGVSRLGYSHGHGQAVNLAAMGEDLKSSNVEFRAWDGTLDPGTIQSQVMMSVAMTERAELNVMQTGHSRPREQDSEIGDAHFKSASQYEGGANGGFSSFLDTMFRKDEDKNQIASLFAVTKWQRS